MKIFEIKNTKYLIVDEAKFEDTDIDLFHKLTANLIECNIEITFIEARVLPEKIIERLVLLNKQCKAKIYTLHLTLWLYLLGLNIDCHLTVRANKSKKKSNIRAIALAGSAGSLEPILHIIKNLPTKNQILKDKPWSIFIVQHLKEGQRSYLPDILNRETAYEVIESKSDTEVKSQTIYCASPDYHLVVIGNYIFNTKEEKLNLSRPSIEKMFNSLSDEYGDELLAVLLSGYGADGVNSLDKMLQKGSTVIIQEPTDCDADVLTKAAINTNHFDYVMNTEKISNFVNSCLTSNSEQQIDNIHDFLEQIHKRYGFDYRNYQLESITRRIQTNMVRNNYPEFVDFSKAVLSNQKIFEDLFLDFSVNVTEFFRDPQTFRIIREKILPYLNSFHHIKIWCAGCSTGEEPYSLAMMLKEENMLHKTQIYATDFNNVILKQAKNGLYSTDNQERCTNRYMESGGKTNFHYYFDTQDNYLKIKQELKDKILFFEHNLVSDSVFNEFNLILCRNTIIYFNDKLQKRVLSLFNSSLRRNGFLVLGKSETLANTTTSKFFNKYDIDNRIYKKNNM